MRKAVSHFEQTEKLNFGHTFKAERPRSNTKKQQKPNDLNVITSNEDQMSSARPISDNDIALLNSHR